VLTISCVSKMAVIKTPVRSASIAVKRNRWILFLPPINCTFVSNRIRGTRGKDSKSHGNRLKTKEQDKTVNILPNTTPFLFIHSFIHSFNSSRVHALYYILKILVMWCLTFSLTIEIYEIL